MVHESMPMGSLLSVYPLCPHRDSIVQGVRWFCGWWDPNNVVAHAQIQIPRTNHSGKKLNIPKEKRHAHALRSDQNLENPRLRQETNE